VILFSAHFHVSSLKSFCSYYPQVPVPLPPH
jgi:hypothetical protein